MTFQQWLDSCRLLRLEARLLVEAVCRISHVRLISRSGDELPQPQRAVLDMLATRRRLGEPMAYLLGSREFYGRSFRVSPAVLIPRPETELLVEAALARLPPGGRLWDLGCGSGIIGLTVALERPDAAVRASDISHDALAVAQANAAALGASIEWAQGSWFAALPTAEIAAGLFDIIASNPPYIEAGDEHLTQGDLRFEPAAALTDFTDGLSHIRTLAAQAQGYLKPGGWLLLEHGWNQGEAVRGILAEHGWQQVEILRDLAGLDRVSIGRKAV